MSSNGSRPSIEIPDDSQREVSDSRWMCSPSAFAHYPGFPDIDYDGYQEIYPSPPSVVRRSHSPTGFTPEPKRSYEDDGQVELATTEVLTPTPRPATRHDPIPISDSDSDPAVPAAVSTTRRGTFTLQTKNIFCTWPKCDVPPKDCMNNILNCSLWKDRVTYAIVCQENHHEADAKHLHALIMINGKRVNLKSCAKLDALTGKHGDYKTARSIKDSVNYIKKDGNYIEHGSCPRKLGEEKLSDRIVKLVKEGKDLRAIDKEVPTAVLLNAQKIKDYIATHKKWKFEDSLPPKALYVTVDTMYAGAGWDMIFNWSNLNLPMISRPIRQTQLYVWGETALGKTRLITWVEQFYHVYHMPHSLWMEDFDEDVHQVAICDEFNGCYPITFINEVLIT